MCVQTYPRRRSRSKCTTHSTPAKPSKHLEPDYNDNEISSSSSSSDASTRRSSISSTSSASSSSSSDGSTRRRKSASSNKVAKIRSLKQPKAPTKKSVSFNEVVMVRPVLHLEDYTDQEIIGCWNIHADKQRTKIDIMHTLRLAKEGNFDGCTRGLEKLLDSGRTRERRRISITEVMEEQEHQRAANQNEAMVYDFVKFRKAYKPYSRSARHVAHAVGKMDEMAAMCQRVSIPHTCTRKCKPKASSHHSHVNNNCVAQTMG